MLSKNPSVQFDSVSNDFESDRNLEYRFIAGKYPNHQAWIGVDGNVTTNRYFYWNASELNGPDDYSSLTTGITKISADRARRYCLELKIIPLEWFTYCRLYCLLLFKPLTDNADTTQGEHRVATG